MSELQKIVYLVKKYGPIIAIKMGYKTHMTILNWQYQGFIPKRAMKEVNRMLKKYKTELESLN